VAKGLSRHPVPVATITRLAVDQSGHGKDVGAAAADRASMSRAH